jgi:hypothetical protein
VSGAHRQLVAVTDSRDEFDGYLAAAIRGDRASDDLVLRTIRRLVVRYCRARLSDAPNGRSLRRTTLRRRCAWGY